MTLLKDNNYKEINVALLSLEADIKNKITNFDTSVIDKQLAEINSRIDKINAGDNNTSAAINDIRYEIEDINSKVNGNSAKIENIEQKLSDIFSAENKVTDFNTTTDSGIYYWMDSAANRPTDYGVLLVNKYDSGSNSIWINQIAYGTNSKIYFRQNINSGNWTEWKAVAFDGEITAKKVANALTVNGKTYDGSEAVDAGVQKIENGGTGATTAKDAFMNLANGLSEDVNPIDTEHIIFKNTDGTNWGLYTLSHFWEYIKGKISSVLGLTKDNYGGKAAIATRVEDGNNAVQYKATSFNGYKIQDTQEKALYVEGRENDSGDSGGIAITNDGVTVFGAGDTDGVLRVINEDNVSAGPVFKVMKNGQVYTTNTIHGSIDGKADTAGTADMATRLKTFAYWNNQFDYDATNGVRVNVYKITMPNAFNSILVQIYDDINYVRCRRYILGLWHIPNYGYNVSVTDLGGTKANGLKVWMGNDGNVYLQADVYWTSRISFSYLDDISDVTITKIGSARYGSNADINGNVLFTPLTDPITDCGALRADQNLSSVSRETQLLKTDVMTASSKLSASSKLVIPIGAPSSLEDGCIWIER